MADLVEHLAEALWQTESIRATDKPRRSPWTDESDITKERWRYNARAALSAIEAAGHRVVPAEPTEAMLEAGEGQITSRNFIRETYRAYRAMLAAAPKVVP